MLSAIDKALAALPVDKVRAQKIVTLLLRDRVLVKLADDLVFHRDAKRRSREQKAAGIDRDCPAQRHERYRNHRRKPDRRKKDHRKTIPIKAHWQATNFLTGPA